MAAIPPPPTPVLLYLGAGYDLSPLLTFAPNPPYEITRRPRSTYTSFLFVDAKPRHTSAYMVPDFDQWIDVPARVRNVVRYAQGMLDRWRVVETSETHGDTDLIWFEGGGSPAHIKSRRADPEWHFVPPQASPSHGGSPTHDDHGPLTTLFYVFNTLDIELARMPALAQVWPSVAALYVHGLRPHAATGLDRLMAGSAEERVEERSEGLEAAGMEAAVTSGTASHTGGLQHVYVLVGSWGTPRHARARGAGAQSGVRDVDFVRAAWREWREGETTRIHDANGRESSTRSPPLEGHLTGGRTKANVNLRVYVPDIVSDSDSDSDPGTHSPLVFRRASKAWLDSDDEWSGSESDGENEVEDDISALPTPCMTTASTLDSTWPPSRGGVRSPRFSTVHIADSPSLPSFRSQNLPTRAPFYTRIPQIAWDDNLNEGLGGYYVSKTVEESLAVWRARGEGDLETEGEDSAEDEDGTTAEVRRGAIHGLATRNATRGTQRPHTSQRATTDARRPQTAPPRLRLRPRPPQTNRLASASAHALYASSASTSDTDVSEKLSPRRRPFWRRGTSTAGGLLVRTPPPPRERRIDLFDFLRAPGPPSHPSHVHKAHSCPDLQGAARRAPRRSFSALRIQHALATLGRRGGRATTDAPRSARSLQRFRFGSGHTPPVPPVPAGTPVSSRTPKSTSKSGTPKPAARHHKPKCGAGRRAPRVVEHEFDWLAWLGFVKPGTDRVGVDSCESDVTRVED